MENSEVSDARIGSSLDSSLQSGNNLDEAIHFVDDSTFEEQSFMENLDSYFDDINNRLTISRMVSTSVIKGMVSAFSEEAAEKIASKEAEVSLLKQRLHSYESNAHEDRNLISVAILEHNCINVDVDHLKITAEQQFQRTKEELEALKGCLSTTGPDYDSVREQWMLEKLADIEKGLGIFKNILRAVYGKPAKMVLESGSPLYEWNWEQELQKEIEHIVFQSFLKTQHEDFQQLSDEKDRCLCHNQNKNLFLKVGELSSLCQDLNDVLRSSFGFDLSKLPAQGSIEIHEEFTNEKKNKAQQKALGSHASVSASLQGQFGSSYIENSQDSKTMPPETLDYHQLKRSTKEEIINYFKAKLTDMKRSHELTLQKMTEDYFSLRRGAFQEKGSCNNRKDRDFEMLRKKIQEVMLKLEDILLENKKSSTFCDGYENIFALKERVNNLLSENKRLQDMLVHECEELKSLFLKLLDTSNGESQHLIMEANFLKQIKKLECDLEDLNMENCIADDVFKCVLREFISENTHGMQDSDIQDSFVSEISAIVFRQAVSDAENCTNLSMAKHNKEKERRIHLEEKLLDNENALHFSTEEIGKLKKEKEMLCVLMEEKEKSALEMGSTLMEQKMNVERVCAELNSLRDHAKQQEVVLAEAKRESQLTNGRLDEALEKIGFYEVQISKLKWELQVAANQLREAEGERSSLFDIIQQKQNSISAAISQQQEQRKIMQSSSASVHKLSTGMTEFEVKAMGNITNYYSRLEALNQQYRMLVQLVNTFKRKELAHKERFERQNSDLKMAEAEVDLLGDEVEALLSLLSKIYIALDHYSLILEHYPGVMEILKLVKRKLQGETNKTIDQKYPAETTATSTTLIEQRKRSTASHSGQSNRMNGGSNAYALM